MRRFCESNGIQIRPATTYTPEQNGVAERAMRTITENARSMLIDAGLAKSYWPDAILTATYVRNRYPTSKSGGEITPFELFRGKRPNLKYIRIFGSKCYRYIEKHQRSKFDSKTKECILVGYTSNGYVVEDRETGKRYYKTRKQ